MSEKAIVMRMRLSIASYAVVLLLALRASNSPARASPGGDIEPI